MSLRLLRLAPLFVLLLTGCVSMQPPASAPQTALPQTPADWNRIKQERQALSAWSLKGRTAVKTSADGWTANLDWAQTGAVSELKLSGALGIGAVRVRLEGNALQIETGQGERLSGPEAVDGLAARLGVTLPLESLRFWLLGVPEPQSPAVAQLDETGRLAQLDQSGWKLTYDRYTHQPERGWLPGEVRVEQGEVRLRLLIDSWKL